MSALWAFYILSRKCILGMVLMDGAVADMLNFLKKAPQEPAS